MSGTFRLAGSVALVVWAGAVLAEDAMTVAGRQVGVTGNGMGGVTLTVDGAALHENGVIYLDPEPQLVGGVTVVTGSAGAGGNACNAAPFVVAFPEGGAPQFYGPVDSCAYLLPQAEEQRLLFISEASSNVSGQIRPDEVWIWTPGDGFGTGPAFGNLDAGSTAAPGWEALEGLAGSHPAEALKMTPVIKALQAGLGQDYPVFAERISDLGSGDLTPDGYLGQACLKFTCEADWAILYLHRESRQVFAIWHVSGEIESQIWPKETTQWPPEAMAALRASVSD